MTQIENTPTFGGSFKILTSQIITADPTTGLLRKPFLKDHTINVSRKSGRILSVNPITSDDLELATDTIDLRGKTVLPGFIDTHVHCECCIMHKYTLKYFDHP